MHRQRIQSQTITHTTSRTPFLPLAYTYNEGDGFKLLQKACFKILKWIGCVHFQEINDVAVHKIDGLLFMDRALKQYEWLQYDLEYDQPMVMIIGRTEYSELTKNEAVYNPFGFATVYEIEKTFLGMAVHVVPWMEGILIVPIKGLAETIKRFQDHP